MEEKEENLYRRKRNIMLIGITFCIVFFLSFLSGCGVNELENQAFPLVMGVEARENESFQLYLAYPDLLNENASEHALASDAYWEGTVTDLFEGMRQMSENSSKNPDLNHLKVLLLNPQVFASDAAMETLLSFFEKKTDAAWNTYVLLTEEPMQEIFTEKLQLPECMGIYLEDLLEEWEHVKHNSFVTVGTLIQEEKLAIGGFAILEQLHLAGNLSLEEGYEALLLQNNLKKYAFSMADGTGVTLEQLRVQRDIVSEQREERWNRSEPSYLSDGVECFVLSEGITEGETAGEMRPVVQIIVNGRVGITNRLEGSTERQQLEAAAKQELEERLQEFAEHWRKAGTDVTDSYALLPGSDRALWHQYRDDETQYVEDLIYEVQVR